MKFFLLYITVRHRFRVAMNRLFPQLTATTEPWPPQWKPFEECPQYVYGMMDEAADECVIEDLIDVGNHRLFMQQLRDTRGYHIDCVKPSFLWYSFQTLPPWFWKGEIKFTTQVEFALKKINEQAKRHGEFYQLQDIVRIVANRPHRCWLYTFNVMQIAPRSALKSVKSVQAMVFIGCKIFELLEWRFRPGPPENPPELPPGSTPENPSTCKFTVDELEAMIRVVTDRRNKKKVKVE